MKNMVLAGLLTAIMLAGIAAAQENRGPRIEVKEIRYDFGKVDQGVQATHVFEIRNAGSEALVIERVQPG